jgi:hypothetical protein
MTRICCASRVVIVYVACAASFAFAQERTFAASHEPGFKPRTSHGTSIPLRSRDLVIKTTDALSTASSGGSVSSYIGAVFPYSIFAASGHPLVPAGTLAKLRFTVTEGKRFYRRPGTVLLSVEPVQVKYTTQAEQSGCIPGILEIELSGTLSVLILKGSGIVLRAGAEGQVRGRRSTSAPSNPPQLSFNGGLAGIFTLPYGALMYGIGAVGEQVVRSAAGRRELYIPEGSTLHFTLEPSAIASCLTTQPLFEAVPATN